MKENKRKITKAGTPVTLLGTEIKVGDKAPDCTLVDGKMQKVKLSDYKGKIMILSVFPSIDTPVCAMQARRFNQAASELGNDVVIVSISKDLPFALNRFCAAEGIDRVVTLSDYMFGEFGIEYGFLIEEMMLLARGIVIVDKSGHVKYVEYVSDITHEPDYKAALEMAEKLYHG